MHSSTGTLLCGFPGSCVDFEQAFDRVDSFSGVIQGRLIFPNPLRDCFYVCKIELELILFPFEWKIKSIILDFY